MAHKRQLRRGESLYYSENFVRESEVCMPLNNGHSVSDSLTERKFEGPQFQERVFRCIGFDTCSPGFVNVDS